ncbi:MAG TPA: ATP-binding cassette domain-containing protein [Firmicutes bacterium]|nr:ATP-binding cassette domain-containing protein [Bacillota bacterium]
MSLLEVTGLTHSFGGKALYKDAAFSLNRGEHMGVVGQNGAGKSTLLRLLVGELVQDEGRIAWQRGVRVGCLDQYAGLPAEQTIEGYLQTAFAPFFALQEELDALYQGMADGAADEAGLERAAQCQTALDQSGFYTRDSTTARVAAGLGLTALGMQTSLGRLSGGQREKVILAKLLLEAPDVLLLDEPTNFLDAAHIDWLADWLAAFPGSFMVVSHDPAFLDRVTNCILDVEFGALSKYSGRYSQYMQQKGQRRADYLREYAAQQRQIQRMEEYIAKNKVRAATARIARGRQKQLDRMERIPPPRLAAPVSLSFPSLPLNAAEPLRVEDLLVGYSAPLLPPLSFCLRAGEKAAVTGFNGIGKSTLLKTLLGRIPRLGGSFRFAEPVRIAYYEQELRWEDDARTPLQEVSGRCPSLSEKEVRAALSRCGVRAADARTPLRALSGGEQSKVKLCLLTLTRSNFLILDEPTNHLDTQTREELRRALAAFPGCALIVSHEADFFEGLVDRVIAMEALLR